MYEHLHYFLQITVNSLYFYFISFSSCNIGVGELLKLMWDGDKYSIDYSTEDMSDATIVCTYCSVGW